MSSNRQHSLRVALVWKGTVHQEEVFTRTSPPITKVGEDEDNDFNVSADGMPSSFEMFERADDGYVVRFTDALSGTLTIDGDEVTLSEAAESHAKRAGTAAGETVYELKMMKGDWGLIRIGEAELYFQVMGQPAAIAGRGLRGLDMPVVGTIGVAGAAHAVFLIMAFLMFDIEPELTQREIPDRFVDFMVEDVDEPPEEKKQKEPQEDTTAKKAGGEEGKFGKEDAEVDESKVPKVDAEMKKKIDVENLGVNKMLASDKIGSGALKNLFGNQDGFDSKMNVAMSGEGSELQIGRGAGGMGLRGTGAGGGGEGFGRVHGLGEVDTGGGQGTGAKIGSKKKRKVKPQMNKGTPKIGDFCDKGNISRVVSRKSNAIQYCYERQLQTNPKLKGKIVAQWKIGLQGQVKSASIAQSSMNNRSVESCITRVIKRMRFEKPDGGICIINYPFVFTGIQ